MDAVKLLKEAQRMCMETEYCEGCPIHKYCAIDTNVFEIKEPEKVVKIIEKWAAEHPKKTRQSEFLKTFPRVRTDDDGVIYMDPCDVDTSYENENRCDNIPCRDCKKEYWLTEVE